MVTLLLYNVVYTATAISVASTTATKKISIISIPIRWEKISPQFKPYLAYLVALYAVRSNLVLIYLELEKFVLFDLHKWVEYIVAVPAVSTCAIQWCTVPLNSMHYFIILYNVHFASFFILFENVFIRVLLLFNRVLLFSFSSFCLFLKTKRKGTTKCEEKS